MAFLNAIFCTRTPSLLHCALMASSCFAASVCVAQERLNLKSIGWVKQSELNVVCEANVVCEPNVVCFDRAVGVLVNYS